MCGIFGCIQLHGPVAPGRLRAQILREMSALSARRGSEGSGWAWVDPEIQPTSVVVKRPLLAKKLLRELSTLHPDQDRVWKRPLILGHTRLATHGSMTADSSLQPIQVRGVLGIHNGIILNYEDLLKSEGGRIRPDVSDSYAFLSLIDRIWREKGDLRGAMIDAVLQCQGTISCAVYVEGAQELLLFTNHGSLYFLDGPGQEMLLWASEARILKDLAKRHNLMGDVCEAQPGNIRRFRWLESKRAFRELENVQMSSSSPSKPLPRLARASPPIRLDSDIQRLSRELDVATVRINTIQRCRRCILPKTAPYIEFDASGVCQFCRHYQTTSLLGHAALERSLEEARATAPSGRELLAFSGGRDSSYALHYLVREVGVRPVAYTYEWGMVNDVSRRNAARMYAELGIEHIIVSADLAHKRRSIRSNIKAWLKRSHLGMVPLFMAGDKAFFRHIHRLRKELSAQVIFFAMNHLENAQFKEDFAGTQYWDPKRLAQLTGPELPLLSRLRLPIFYGLQFLVNPSYLNRSLPGSLWG